AVNLLAASQPDDFLRALGGRWPDDPGYEPLIKKLLKCEGVTIFQPIAEGERLIPTATTGIKWLGPEEWYSRQEHGGGLTARVWCRKQPLVANDTNQSRTALEAGGMRSEELVTNPRAFAGLWVPFIDPHGSVIAVARCRNRSRTDAVAWTN